MYYVNEELLSLTRYDMIKFFEFNKDNIDALTSYFALHLKDLPYIGERVVQAEVKRPDLLSYNIYGSTQYWWILMWYNDILSINDLTLGTKIKYPSYSDIEALYVQTSTQKKAQRTI